MNFKSFLVLSEDKSPFVFFKIVYRDPENEDKTDKEKLEEFEKNFFKPHGASIVEKPYSNTLIVKVPRNMSEIFYDEVDHAYDISGIWYVKFNNLKKRWVIQTRTDEAIVDKSDAFKQKQRDNFYARLQKVADEIPNHFKRQEDIEAAVRRGKDEILSKGATAKSEFKYPSILSQFRKNINPVEALYHVADDELVSMHDKKLVAFAKQIVSRDKDKIIKAVETDLAALKKLHDLARKAPAPQYAHEPISYTSHLFQNMLEFFKKFKPVTEARTMPKHAYSVIEVKGKVDRVIAVLEGKHSASWTKISNQYKELDKNIKKLEEKRKDLNKQIKDRAATEIFAVEDEVLTRVVETCGMTITLSKKTKTEDSEKVDYEAVVKALAEANLPAELSKMLNELIKAHTKAVPGKTTPERLTIDVKEGVGSFISNIVDRIKMWFKRFDKKFNNISAMIKSL